MEIGLEQQKCKNATKLGRFSSEFFIIFFNLFSKKLYVSTFFTFEEKSPFLWLFLFFPYLWLFCILKKNCLLLWFFFHLVFFFQFLLVFVCFFIIYIYIYIYIYIFIYLYLLFINFLMFVCCFFTKKNLNTFIY
jgi:hypothetical protein